MKEKNVVIIGGGGFLGYHASMAFINKGFSVNCIVMPEEIVDSSLSNNVNLLRLDIDNTSDEELINVFSSSDYLIYAAGPDDRVHLDPGVDSSWFFHKYLVARTARIFHLATKANVKKGVIFGSYFSYINNHGLKNLKPNTLLKHPYIKARKDQMDEVFKITENKMEVSVLSIPYVFGVTPTKTSLWKSIFVDNYKDTNTIYYGNGSTTAISAKKVGLAAYYAAINGKDRELYPIGSANITFVKMISLLLKSAGINKKVGKMPNFIMNFFMRKRAKDLEKNNISTGLNIKYLNKDILSKDFIVDYKNTDRLLDITYEEDIKEVIIETGKSIRADLDKEQQLKNSQDQQV